MCLRCKAALNAHTVRSPGSPGRDVDVFTDSHAFAATGATVERMGVIRFQRIASRARLYVADEFLAPAEIEHAQAVGRSAEQDERVATGKRDGTGYSYEMPVAGDATLGAIGRRIAIALGYANAAGGTFRYRRYRPTEAHPLHGDTFRIGSADLVATAMLWLTDDCEGGETYFPDAGPAVTLSARQGRLAVWLNYRADGTADPAAVHLARPVTRGEKITLTEFVYGTPPGTPAFAAGLEPERTIDGVRLAE